MARMRPLSRAMTTRLTSAGSIARKASGIHETFTVRRISYGEGVERVFPVNSPNIEKIDLLAAKFVPDRLDVVGANLLEPDFLDDPRRLVDQRVLGSLDDLDRAVRPIDFAHESRIGNRLAQHFRMLLVERDVLSDFALGHEPPNAGPTRFVHFLADFQVLLCEAQDIGLRSGELGSDGNLLLVRQREGGKFLLDRLDMRSRSDA